MTTSIDLRPGNKVLHNASGSTAAVIDINNDVVELQHFPDNIHCSADDMQVYNLQVTCCKSFFFK